MIFDTLMHTLTQKPTHTDDVCLNNSRNDSQIYSTTAHQSIFQSEAHLSAPKRVQYTLHDSPHPESVMRATTM